MFSKEEEVKSSIVSKKKLCNEQKQVSDINKHAHTHTLAHMMSFNVVLLATEFLRGFTPHGWWRRLTEEKLMMTIS